MIEQTNRDFYFIYIDNMYPPGIVLDSVALLRENPNVKLSDENGVTKELEDGRRRVRLLPSRSYKVGRFKTFE